MSALRLSVVLLGVLSASLHAQTTYVTPAKPGSAEVATQGALEAARSGNEVALTWTLPAGEVRIIEIYRNASSEAPGRKRVGSPRADLTVWSDEVPDGATYWYWIKLTRPNGVVVNIGPVSTPGATIWQPAP